jgi:Mor family transcriptional regulator
MNKYSTRSTRQFSYAIVQEIRAYHKDNPVSQRYLAKMYKCSQASIYNILYGKGAYSVKKLKP